MSHSSAVGIATGYGMDDRGVGVRVQAGYGVQTASNLSDSEPNAGWQRTFLFGDEEEKAPVVYFKVVLSWNGLQDYEKPQSGQPVPRAPSKPKLETPASGSANLHGVLQETVGPDATACLQQQHR
jgi:hypothetical protein